MQSGVNGPREHWRELELIQPNPRLFFLILTDNQLPLCSRRSLLSERAGSTSHQVQPDEAGGVRMLRGCTAACFPIIPYHCSTHALVYVTQKCTPRIFFFCILDKAGGNYTATVNLRLLWQLPPFSCLTGREGDL